MSAPSPTPELRARILAAARAEPVPSRAAGRSSNLLLALGGLIVPVVMSLRAHGPDLGRRPVAYVVALAAGWLAVCVLATWGGVMRGTSMLGRPPSWRLVVATLTPAALLVTALVASLVWPEVETQPSGTTEDVKCILFSLASGAGPLVAFALMRRGSDPVAPALTGGALGAAAGAWAALSIELHCPYAAMHHVLVGHLAPVVAFALLGALVGHFVVGIRARPS